jgi:hypothetical protein
MNYNEGSNKCELIPPMVNKGTTQVIDTMCLKRGASGSFNMRYLVIMLALLTRG